jgi:hypothetical protein
VSYPFDPDVRKRLTEVLHGLLPALYRVRDLPAGKTSPKKIPGRAEDGELYRFLKVLIAPLAETRQNIDELYADLFIDTSADWVLSYLAEMVGTTLVFPDAPSNRRDVRGTVDWRRRKGTPAMLEEMGTELLGHATTLKEGWKLVLLAQDLDLVRLERTVVGYRPAVVAEQGMGPLDVLSHTLDARRIAPRLPGTGGYHPKHLTHYTFPTQLFPLAGAEPVSRTPMVPEDLRYAFDPLNSELALRVRASRSDRVPPMHFAARPGDSFDQQGTSSTRFSVKILGLPAGVAAPLSEERSASRLPASPSLVEKDVKMIRLAHGTERWQSQVEVAVLAVPHVAGVPNLIGAVVRGKLTLDAETANFSAGSPALVAGDVVAMLRLRPVNASATYFPGSTIEIAGQSDDASMAAEDVGLAALGFLRGAFVVDLPAGWIFKALAGPDPGERYLYLAADGGVTNAEIPGNPPTIAPLVSSGGGAYTLPGALLSSGPGPAWPPLPPTASLDRWTAIPCAEGSGPVVIHGGSALQKVGAKLVPAPVGIQLGLVFAARVKSIIEPFLRLDIAGSDPTTATASSVLDPNATVLAGAAARARLFSLATFAENNRDAVELYVRLESDTPDIVLPPCEVAYSSVTGRPVLIHLPAMDTDPPTVVDWHVSTSLTERGDPVVVAEDGATYLPSSPQVLRFAYGPIAPIREAASHRRRRVRQRNLCPWKHENGKKLPPVPLGWIDIDPSAGLFAIALFEPPPATTAVLGGLPVAPSLTIDKQDGYSDHIGARPDARAPWLDAELPVPTRLVSRLGHHQRSATLTWHQIPVYGTVKAALDAIASDSKPADHEVIEIQDSATYVEQNLAWPANVLVRSLTLQAAERERPVIRLQNDWPKGAAVYTALTATGILFAQGANKIGFPPANRVVVAFTTVADPESEWEFNAGAKEDVEITILRAITGRIKVVGQVKLRVTDSVVDATAPGGFHAVDSELIIDRSTVIARGPPGHIGVHALVLEASECLFDARVVALDRFHGCIRYCRVGADSQLPRRHRVVEDEPIFVTRDRHEPAHLRLSEKCPQAIVRGAEDGAEVGAFHGVRFGQRTEALVRRLMEYTPAGLVTGLVRMD